MNSFEITLLRVIPTMTCWVKVVRWGLPPHSSFLPFRTHHLVRPIQLKSTWQTTKVKTCQTCSNMSKHVRIRPDKHIKETEIKHVSRPPEARSKVIATATVHAQTCQNMSGYDLTNISQKQKSNMSVDLQRVRSISYSNRSLRRQAVESKCRVRCQEVFKDSYTGQFCKRSSVAAPLASNLSVNSRR